MGGMRTLREWRAAKVMSIQALVAATGVSNKTIVEIEHGRRVPNFQTIRRLSEALGVEPTEVEEFANAIEERSKPPRTTRPRPMNTATS